MAHQVKVEVRAGETLQFPPICTNCGEPGTEMMRLRRRLGRVTREIDVPVCADCARELSRLSGEEERRRRVAWVAGTALWLGLSVLFFLVLPAAMRAPVRVLLAVVPAAALGIVVGIYLHRDTRRFARQEKLDVLNAAAIEDFSWRVTTFRFANEAFAQGFRSLNGARLKET